MNMRIMCEWFLSYEHVICVISDVHSPVCELVLWVLIPLEATLFFADFETTWSQFCTKMTEMSDLRYLGKTQFNVQYGK